MKEKNNGKMMRIPDAELDIMLILWEKKNEDGSYAPSKIADVYNGMQEVRPCTRSAIHSLIDRLSDRGFVKIELIEAPVSYKHLTPLVSEEEYREAESDTIVNKLWRGNWRTLITTLIDTGKITDDDIGEIAQMLKERREEEE